MIESKIIVPLTLTSNNSVVTFQADDLRTKSASNCNGWLCHTEGSPIYKLRQCGVYDVVLTANIAAPTVDTYSLGIQEDGVVTSQGDQTIRTAGDVANITVHKAVKVCCNSSTSVSIASVPSVLTGTTGTTPATTGTPIITSATLTITKRP